MGYYILEIINRHLCQIFCHYLVFRLKWHMYVCCVCVCAQSLRRVRLFATPWADCNLLGFSVLECPRQEYWSRLSSPIPRDLPEPGIEAASPALAGSFFTTAPPGKSVFLQVQNQMKSALLSKLTDCQMSAWIWSVKLEE